MFDAVFFDLDGTLIDSEAVGQVAGTIAFASLGIEIEPEFLHSMIGIDDETSEGMIRARFPGLDTAVLDAARVAEVRRRYAEDLPLKPGTHQVLEAIRLPKALVTSSTRSQADYKLDLSGLGPHFAHIVTFDDVSAAKPDPEPYLLAARLLGVDPARCVVFEDSEAGARAAHAAGMTVVQIPDIIPASGSFAHLVAPDLIAGARGIGLI